MSKESRREPWEQVVAGPTGPLALRVQHLGFDVEGWFPWKYTVNGARVIMVGQTTTRKRAKREAKEAVVCYWREYGYDI